MKKKEFQMKLPFKKLDSCNNYFQCSINSTGIDEEVWLVTPKIRGKQFTINLGKIAAISNDVLLTDLCLKVQGKTPDKPLYTCTARFCPECYANLDQEPHKNYCNKK